MSECSFNSDRLHSREQDEERQHCQEEFHLEHDENVSNNAE